MFSRFFIDRPIFATVLSIIITLAGGVAVWTLPDRAVPADHAAEHHRLHHLPRRRRPHRRRVGGRAHRAAGQRRREHDVHVLAGRQRRLVQPQRHLQARRQPEFRPGAGAEPRQPRPAAAAQTWSADRRHHAQAQPRHPPHRQPLFAERPLQPARPQQLRLHPLRRRDQADRRRRRRVPVRRAGLQHARLGRPRPAGGPRPDRHGRRRRRQGAEHPGVGRPARPAALRRQTAVPAHAHHPRPAGRARAVREHHHPHHAGRPDHTDQGHRPRRKSRAKSQDVANKLDFHPSTGIAIFQLPDANALDTADRIRAKMEELKKQLPARHRLLDGLRHHAVRRRVDRRGGQDADRGDHPRGHRRADLPAELALDASSR